MKTWNYIAVTQEAERRITSLMDDAKLSNREEAAIKRQWAYGVYLLWDSLTIGWREDGDGQRMESLTQLN